MIEFRFLQTGVYGLANAHRVGTMAGHLGAAVLAGYFLGEDLPDLSPEVYRGIESELARVIAGEEAIWWNVGQSGVTASDLFRALPPEPPLPESIPTLADALREGVGATRQSGHDVIFTSLALRALTDHPDLATPSVVNGICKLVAGFQGAHAGRGYFGRERGWLNGNQVLLTLEDLPPLYGSIPGMARATLQELIATAHIRKQGFGGLWHLINHAAAIAELDRYGEHELARRALLGHHQHWRLWRMLPDVTDELGPVPKATHQPTDPVYWSGMLKRDEARLTHRIKTLFGYGVLKQVVDDAELLAAADDAFLYLMT